MIYAGIDDGGDDAVVDHDHFSAFFVDPADGSSNGDGGGDDDGDYENGEFGTYTKSWVCL